MTRRPALPTARLMLGGLLLAASTATAATPLPIPEPPKPTGLEIPLQLGVRPAIAALDDGFLVAFVLGDGPRRVVASARDSLGESGQAPIDLGPYEDGPGGLGGGISVAALRDGYVVVWTGPRPDAGVVGVYARRLFRSGLPAGPAELVSGPGPRARFDPDVAADAAGRYAISWTTDRSPESALDVFARRFEADGSPDGSAFLIHEDVHNSQRAGRLAFLPDGTLVAVWESFEGEARLHDVLMRSFGPAGAPLGGEEVVHTDPDTAAAGQTVPEVAPLADGGFVVAWNGYFARLFTAAGAPRSDDLVLGEGAVGPSPPALAGMPGGGFVILWETDCGPACGHTDVVGRGVGADGIPLADVFRLAIHDIGAQTGPAVAVVPAPGIAFAVWETHEERVGRLIVERRISLPCLADGRSLCLGGSRFRASVLALGHHFPQRPAIPVQRGDRWGTFWFFRPENVEIAIKVLDGRPVNDHFWVFYGSLTNLDFTLWVEDLLLGTLVRYENPLGTLASRGDTAALPSPPAALGAYGAVVTAPYAARAGGLGSPLTPAGTPCVAGTTRACLQGERFAVEIEWADFFGNRGTARHGDLTADTAYFWFFHESNPEIVVKVLDGRPVNGRFWVFFASLTNVEFTLRVTDTETGQTATYHNPLHHFASVGDTAAFPR